MKFAFITCIVNFLLTPASHMEVGCPRVGNKGLELPTSNPGKLAIPAAQPRAPSAKPSPHLSTRHTDGNYKGEGGGK